MLHHGSAGGPDHYNLPPKKTGADSPAGSESARKKPSLRRSRFFERALETTLSRSNPPTRFPSEPLLALAAARTAAPRPGQPRGYRKPAVTAVIQEIHLHRTDLVEEARFHEIGKPIKRKHLVVFSRLIQSHAQCGPPSADVGHVDPDR